MKLGGCRLVPAEQQRVYELLQDPQVLSRAIPGCKELVRGAENEYQMKMKVVISSISGLFDGKVRLSEQNPPQSYRLTVDGIGRAGFVKGDGVLTLAAEGAQTQVSYEGEVQTGGLIAGVGQRLLEVTAKMLIKRFFARICAEVQAAGSAQPAAEA